jgi:hypothetical protein
MVLRWFLKLGKYIAYRRTTAQVHTFVLCVRMSMGQWISGAIDTPKNPLRDW